MKHSKRLTALGTALAIAAIAPLLVAAQSGPLSDDLVDYNDDYNGIVARYDAEAFLGLYNDNPLWIAPTDAPVAGLDVPSGTFAFIKENKGVLTHTADHTFISKDESQAVLIGRYDIAIDSVGSQRTGTYLFVLERQKDEWKIVVDMFNEHEIENTGTGH